MGSIDITIAKFQGGAQFALQDAGLTAVKHQREVGTRYFDEVRAVVLQGHASTGALAESTEPAQF